MFKPILAALLALTLGTTTAIAQRLPTYPDKPAVRVVGLDVNEQFFVYDLTGSGLNDLSYFSDRWKFSTPDLIGFVYILTPDDLQQPGVVCEALCVNGSGQVVGLSPHYVQYIHDVTSDID